MFAPGLLQGQRILVPGGGPGLRGQEGQSGEHPGIHHGHQAYGAASRPLAPGHGALWRGAGLMNHRLERHGAALACASAGN